MAKSAAGKAISSRNAVKHGLGSPHPVIIEGLETVEEWERFCDSIVENYAPDGALERVLAERVALLLWRMRRVPRQETAVINFQVHSTEDDLALADMYFAPKKDEVPDPDPLRVVVHKEKRVIPGGKELDRIMRYEAHLHRQFLQTHHEIEARQSRRRGEPTHLARLDISAPPS